jgi:hypothetical protein
MASHGSTVVRTHCSVDVKDAIGRAVTLAAFEQYPNQHVDALWADIGATAAERAEHLAAAFVAETGRATWAPRQVPTAAPARN